MDLVKKLHFVRSFPFWALNPAAFMVAIIVSALDIKSSCHYAGRDARNPMPNQSAPEIEVLLAAYAAFNARDTDAALATMTADVAWPRAFKGGFVHGREAVRTYWTEQWSEISPHVEPLAFYREDSGCILVGVHQIVRDLAGAVLADVHVGHRFTVEQGLIQKMEVCPPPPRGHRA
jgi:hypothetical protein